MLTKDIKTRLWELSSCAIAMLFLPTSPRNASESFQKSTFSSHVNILYIDLIYPGDISEAHTTKVHTVTIKCENAEFQHYIPMLARRSRSFAHTWKYFKQWQVYLWRPTVDLVPRNTPIICAKPRAASLLLSSIPFNQLCGILPDKCLCCHLWAQMI